MTKKLKLAVATILGGIAMSAGAQNAYVRPAYQFPPLPSGSGPASIQLGESPVFLTPNLLLAVGRDDNLFYSNANEKSSTFYLLGPGFSLDSRDANKVLQLSYEGRFGRYAQSEDDNFVDHTLRTQADIAFDRRNFLKLGLDYLRGHDPRGATDRPIAGRPDRYRSTNPSATYAFGAPGAQGRLEAYYNHADKRYLNNFATTAASDHKAQEYGAAFYARVMPRTYFLVEARETQIDYRQSGSPLSGDERRLYAGISWEPTAATTGTVKVGNLKRRFDSSVLADFSGPSWEAIVRWEPRSYSRLEVFTARQTTEASGLGNFILTSITGAAWTHGWSSAVSTGIDLRFQKDEYQGFNRNEDTQSLGLKVAYKFRRWLTLGAEYTHTKRDSSLPAFDYDKNLYLLTATMSM
ncbi:MAG: outer membrane beta-barrel protein [Usitatibacter sp.]